VNPIVAGIGGMACDVSLKGNVTVVFVTYEDGWVHSTFAEACASAHAHVWEGEMSYEFHVVFNVGTFTLVGVVPAGTM